MGYFTYVARKEGNRKMTEFSCGCQFKFIEDEIILVPCEKHNKKKELEK